MVVKFFVAGDVVGHPGCQTVERVVPRLVEREGLDFVSVNGENAAGSGNGIGPREARRILQAGVAAITLGDHVWRQPDVVGLLESNERIARPANLPASAAGKAMVSWKLPSGVEVLVVTLLGRVFMDMPAGDPFETADAVLASCERREGRIVVVEVHAEATSEKCALARHLDGRVSAVVGTHTHVQTADERILPGGTAFITDLGMTGAMDSILGRKVEPVLHRMRTSMHARFEVASGDLRMQGAIVEADSETGRALSIRRVNEPV